MKQFYNHIFRFGKYLQDQKFLKNDFSIIYLSELNCDH